MTEKLEKNKHLVSLCCFPVIESEADLIDLISRMAWFLSFCPIYQISIPISSASLKEVKWRVASGMDGSIAKNFDLIRPKVVLVLTETESDLDACMSDASIVLRWKMDSLPHFFSAKSLAACLKGKKVLDVDPIAVRQEGSTYIDIGYSLVTDKKVLVQENKLKFQRMANKLECFDRAYVMATGPSISQYRHFDYSTALTIVCNSVINDEELMDIVCPQILVFADPIFHFGPSEYAAAFRSKLAESAQKHDYTICIPIKYYPLFVASMPQLAERTIALPFLKDRVFNFNLSHDFVLKTTANILTFLMVPLASTFAKEIGILGCDGRSMSDNSYFWRHNANTQFNDKMANIRTVHPGFFAIDYDDYYLEHCQTLEAQIMAGEAVGKKITSLSFSYIPALNSRYGRGLRLARTVPNVLSSTFLLVDSRTKVASDPNWNFVDVLLSAVGSFPRVTKAVGICRQDVDASVIAMRPDLLPLLPPYNPDDFVSDWGIHHSHRLGFGDDFDNTLSQLCSSDKDVLLFLPSASLDEARGFAVAVAHHPNLRLHITVKVDEQTDFEDVCTRSLLEWLSNSEPRIVMSLPSNEMCQRVAEQTGCILNVAPDHPTNYAEAQSFVQSLFFADAFDQSVLDAYPRLLVIDLTNMTGLAATSRIKEVFFGLWPDAKFRLVCLEGGKRLIMANKSGEKISLAEADTEQILDDVIGFQPELIYYRAVDDTIVHNFVKTLLSRSCAPFVIHLMDDWPARLRLINPAKFGEFDLSLRMLLERASLKMSISQKMSSAFEERYDHKFFAFANGIDISHFPPKVSIMQANRPFVIRYAGALAKDMTFDSICDIADAVELLSERLNVRLEIFTRQPWLDQAKQRLSSLRAVSVLSQVPAENYSELLQEADALLIAYNFDEQSQTYIGYSLANKLPEYLASGNPVVAYGPLECATIEYASNLGCALIIPRRDQDLISSELERLIQSKDLQNSLAEKGRSIAILHHNIWKIQRDFQKALIKLACNTSTTAVFGPFLRSDSAHWDETNGIAELFGSVISGAVMIDVGAHHGSALMPFINKGWSVFAFEPDVKNRANLLDKLAKHKNKQLVSLDTRCVSNKSQKGVSFFTSDQSTGISGLSAFHETHQETQSVDVTTLTEFFHDNDMPSIDFLKIDTEGHDLFVLQGFPWERGKPAVIECEFEDTKTVPLGYTFHDLARFLVDKGYTVYVSEWHPIIRYGIRHDWHALKSYPCELTDSKGWGNFLAFRDPIDEQALVAAVKKVLKVGKPDATKAPSQLPSPPLLIPVVNQYKSQEQGFRIEPSSNFSRIAPDQWRYADSNAKQKLLVAVLENQIFAQRTLVGHVRIQANCALTLNLSMGRHGNSEYEGASTFLALNAGEIKTVVLKKTFSHSHQASKLQIDVLTLSGAGSAILTVDQFGIAESTDSVWKRLGAGELNTQTANRLFRQKDYVAALTLYLLLSHKYELSMYADNAVRASRAAGMPWVKQINDISWLENCVEIIK